MDKFERAGENTIALKNASTQGWGYWLALVPLAGVYNSLSHGGYAWIAFVALSGFLLLYAKFNPKRNVAYLRADRIGLGGGMILEPVWFLFDDIQEIKFRKGASGISIKITAKDGANASSRFMENSEDLQALGTFSVHHKLAESYPTSNTVFAGVKREDVNFLKAVSTCFYKIFTFTGRASRSEYWYWILCIIVGMVISEIIISWIGAGRELTISILTFSAISAQVRRLHDTNKSGWWLMVPVILSALGQGITDNVYWSGLFQFLAVFGVIILLVWTCARGDTTVNRFG